ncbi:MAG: MFS transporter [Thermodesulfovibrionales bacterium]
MYGRFTAFSFRDYRLFWVGQLISLSGTWMQSVAQSWLVYSLTRSPLYLGMVAAAGSLPMLFLTLVGGVIADRFPKRRLLIITQSLSIIPAVLLGALTQTGTIEVWHVGLLAFFLGTVNALDVPTRQSFLVEMVDRGHIVNAIALNSAAFNSARIIGPVIAGIAIAAFGVPACFYLNAASFVAVIAALFMISAPGRSRGESEGMVRDLSKGIGFIRENREIRASILLIAVYSLIGIPYISLLPVFAAEVLGRDARGLGFLMAASGVGAVTAALGIALRSSISDKPRLIFIAGLCFSASLVAFSLSATFGISLAAICLGSWGMVTCLAVANSFIQIHVPDELRGRVMSVYSFVFLGTAPIGNSAIGLVADRIGSPKAVTVAGALCVLASLAFRRLSQRAD